jgi:hypothetical protein
MARPLGKKKGLFVRRVWSFFAEQEDSKEIEGSAEQSSKCPEFVQRASWKM